MNKKIPAYQPKRVTFLLHHGPAEVGIGFAHYLHATVARKCVLCVNPQKREEVKSIYKIVSAEEAVGHVKTGDTICINAFTGILYPDYTVAALEKRFLEKGDFGGLTYFATSSQGSAGLSRFSDRLAKKGLITKAITSFYETSREMGALADANEIAAYNIPQGVLCQLLQAAAGNRPGIITKVGLNTFIDPRYGGGKMNAPAMEEFVRLMEIDGEEYLFYKAHKIDICILRGTTVDPNGNITMEKEAITMDALNIAMAAKANHGTVIVQVERRGADFARPKEVVIPGIFVDYVVLDPDQWQTKAEAFVPYYTGEIRMPAEEASTYNEKLSAKYAQFLARRHGNAHRYVAKRCTQELFKGALINLGTGIPEIIGGLAEKEGINGDMVFTVESGIIGGVAVAAPNFGVAINHQVTYDVDKQFNLYDGRGLDLCFVGAAQIDREGNVNVSKVGSKYIGVGGFVNITSNARKVIFTSTLRAGMGEVKFENGKLVIVKEAPVQKFMEAVEQISFSGAEARRKKQKVLYITERCVFELEEDGLVLTEIAPGIDVQRDILDQIGFVPRISEELKKTDERVFSNALLGLNDKM